MCTAAKRGYVRLHAAWRNIEPHYFLRMHSKKKEAVNQLSITRLLSVEPDFSKLDYFTDFFYLFKLVLAVLTKNLGVL